MSKLNRTILLIFSCVLALGVSGCQEKKSASYLKVNVGEELFCIPKDYFEFPHVNDEDGGFLIGALYPEMSPMKGVLPQDVGKDFYFKNNIGILAQPIVPLDKPLPWVEMFPRGYEVLSDQREYGLVPTRRLPGNNLHEIWFLEGESPKNSHAARISCTDAKKEGDPEYRNPQCSFRYPHNSVSYKISFSRQILPEWKDIQKKVSSLVNSFDCKNFEQKGE